MHPVDSYGIHWFRRDLRVNGNPALQKARERHQGRVVGVFVFDPKFLARPDIGTARFAFLIETLACLREELRDQGSDLLVLDRGPERAFEELFSVLKTPPQTVSFNRDYEPFAMDRDTKMTALFSKRWGVEVLSDRDHLLIEPHEIYRDKPGSAYRIYSAFQKKWLKEFSTPEIRARIAGPNSGKFRLTWKNLQVRLPDALEPYRKKIRAEIDIPLPKAGSAAALEKLKRFADEGLADYAERRDLPGIAGTSQVSIYLKNGSMTTAEIIRHLKLERKPGSKYLSELIWREFYYHILAHFPEVEKAAFLPKFRKLKWENNKKLFRAWKEGQTGYPIVDAGMRQLNQTGWMHNRVRMIVASFLTKDLLIDWRWGERYFMEKLLDGDLAPNNGGWQWAASTGCDPQPYFRIFNPVLQSKRFDPDGDYIRQFVPELRNLDSKKIHEPQKAGKIANYPAPIVEHAVQARKAIALFHHATQ